MSTHDGQAVHEAGHYVLTGEEGTVEFYEPSLPKVQLALTWVGGTVSLFIDGRLAAVRRGEPMKCPHMLGDKCSVCRDLELAVAHLNDLLLDGYGKIPVAEYEDVRRFVDRVEREHR
jgi:hypothetical protein